MSTIVWFVIVYFVVGMLTAVVVRGLCWLSTLGPSVPSWEWRKEIVWCLRATLLWPFVAFALAIGLIIFIAAAITVSNIARARSTFGSVEQHESCEPDDAA